MQPSLISSRILVVDDITKNLQVVGTVLRNQGYKVMAAASGAEALKCVRTQLPDLILLDLMMPVVSGYTILEQLEKQRDPDDYRPVLVLTADATLQAKRRALALGAKDFLTKPFAVPLQKTTRARKQGLTLGYARWGPALDKALNDVQYVGIVVFWPQFRKSYDQSVGGAFERKRRATSQPCDTMDLLRI